MKKVYDVLSVARPVMPAMPAMPAMTAVPAMPAVPAIPARGPPLKNILTFSLFVPSCLINQAVIDQIVTKLQRVLHPMCA